MTQNIDFLARAWVLSKTVGTITNTDHQVIICKINEKNVQIQKSILHSPNLRIGQKFVIILIYLSKILFKNFGSKNWLKRLFLSFHIKSFLSFSSKILENPMKWLHNNFNCGFPKEKDFLISCTLGSSLDILKYFLIFTRFGSRVCFWYIWTIK